MNSKQFFFLGCLLVCSFFPFFAQAQEQEKNIKYMDSLSQLVAQPIQDTLQLALQYKYKGDFAKSIRILYQLLPILPKNHIERPTVFVFLAKNYMDIEDYENALYFYREAAKTPSSFIYKTPTDSIPIHFDTREYLNKPLGFAEVFEKLNQLDSAAYYIKLAHKRLSHVSEKEFWKSAFHWKIIWSYGRIEERLRNDENALKLYRHALIVAKKTPSEGNVQLIQNSLAYYFNRHHQIDSATFYAKMAFQNAQKTSNFQVIKDTGFLLKSIYEQTGKAEKALFYCNVANNAKDTLLNTKKLQAIQKLSIQQERDTNELALVHLQQQNRFKLYGLLGSLLFVLSIVVILYRSNRQKQHLNEQLAHQKAEIEDLNSHLEEKVVLRTAELQNALHEVLLAFNKGQLTERKRVSADLHDEIGSALSTIALFSDIAKLKAKNTAPDLVYEITRIGNKAREMVQTMQDTIWILNEKSQQSIWERMNSIGSEMLQAKNINLNWIMPNEKNVPIFSFTQKRHIFLIFKEAINNIIKHSNASTVTIEGTQEDSQFVLKITDNGHGFDTNIFKKEGNGLRNFEERMKEIGGQAKIYSQIGSGTSLILTFPKD